MPGPFNRRGVEKVYFAPAIVAVTAPTVAELTTAGKNITAGIRELGGFSFAGSTEDASDMDSLYPSTVGGMQTVSESTIKFKEGSGSSTDPLRVIEALFPMGTTGYIVFSPLGAAAATQRARVWPVQVISNSPDESAESGVATYTVTFSIPSPPTLAATIAA